MEAILSREQVYLEIVEGWLRNNRGIVFPEGAVDDLCDRIAANNERLKEQISTLRELREYDRIKIEQLKSLIDRSIAVHGVGTS
jgi:hypothetical protein